MSDPESAQAAWENEGERQMQFAHACMDAIENTAARLGLDPAAFAEACQDGSFLDDAVLLAGNKRPLTVVESQLLDRWLDKLATLKRAEPKP